MFEEELPIEQVEETPNESQDVCYTIKGPLNEENAFWKASYPNWQCTTEIPPMRNVDKKHLSGASTKVDAMFKKITLNNITTLKKVMCCGGIITSKLLGVRNSKGNQKNYLMWKKRLEN